MSFFSKFPLNVCRLYRNAPPIRPHRRLFSCDGPIQSKVVIITGACRGIGLDIAKSLLKAGAKKLVLSDVLVKECEKAATELNKTYCDKVYYQPCDVTKPAQIEKMLQCAVERFGQVDIFVNNAGILADSEWEKTVDINIKGLVSGTFLAMKYMGAHECRGKGGVVVNITSILGTGIFTGSPVYVGSKHFVVGFTRSIGSKHYYDLTRVKVMAMGPGVTDTDMISGAKKRAMKTFGDLSSVFDKELLALPAQKPEKVGECVVKMLTEGTNGSYWISEANECYKVKIPDRKSMKDGSGDCKPAKEPPKKPEDRKLCQKEEKKDCPPKKEEKKECLPKKEEKKKECPPKKEEKKDCAKKPPPKLDCGKPKKEDKKKECPPKKEEKKDCVKKPPPKLDCGKKEPPKKKEEKKDCKSAESKPGKIDCSKLGEKKSHPCLKKEEKPKKPAKDSKNKVCTPSGPDDKKKTNDDGKTSNLLECTKKCKESAHKPKNDKCKK